MASLIVDICAMSVRHHSQAGDNSFTKKLSPHLSYLMENGVSAPSYNVSLHNNLRKNIEAKFPSCSLSKFKHTSLKRHPLGRTFYYDIEVAGKVLGFDPSWVGKGGQGFAEEVARANVNLSLVQAQVVCFQNSRSA
jgi:nuclear pore complex protein Nup188